MDNTIAAKKLNKAFDKIHTFSAKSLSDENKIDIDKLVNGHHLTFRYILMTALLAKVVDPTIHMRSLQAQSDLDGAYDARSLCHKVFVPFEQSTLKGKLGGSNEPYLNKPARFPDVNLDNPVRKGKDAQSLTVLFHLLNRLNDSKANECEEALIYALQLADKRSAGLVHDIKLPEVLYTSDNTWSILDNFLSKSCGGETAAAVTGAILRFSYTKPFSVIVHPANQCGASSKEVGDIDVRQGKSLLLAFEVKDKLFSLNDVTHAIRKVAESGSNYLGFMLGRHAYPLPANLNCDTMIDSQAANGIDLSFLDIDEFIQHHLNLMPASWRKELFVVIAQVLDDMRATDTTKKHFQSSLFFAPISVYANKLRSTD